MRLYTVDIQTNNLEIIDDPMLNMKIKEKKAIRDKLRKDMFKQLLTGKITTWQEFSKDPDFKEMRKGHSSAFEKEF